MLCIHRHNAAERTCDPVDAEWLRIIYRIRLGKDDRSLENVREMDTVDRIAHLQLIRAVALLRHNTRERIRQHAKPVVGVCCRSTAIQDWIAHSTHHLGTMSTPVIPPFQPIALLPGEREGKTGA